jgi:putative ABC transport system ATP-binding protein
MSVLELRSLSKVYGRGAAEVQALRDVSLTVAAGEMVAVMGPSGSGKSSLLTISGTLEEPTSGAVLINGEDTLRMSGGAKSRIRRRMIGYVFQTSTCCPGSPRRRTCRCPWNWTAPRCARRTWPR